MTERSEYSPDVLEDVEEEMKTVGDGGVASKLRENADMTGDLARALQGA